ncbi:MAG: UDP-3-O-(3-hydroxymyristoyl)glucosamine N-acyltransferase [Acidobacteriota bacterium]|nr:UDP-3-O-(3-hydroxymyristoyl)glucosamine N-acyltransferase [Acidobacteriota bacterium]
MKLKEIADRLGCQLDGDGEIDVVRVSGIEHATAGDLTFFAHRRYATHLAETRASAVIAGKNVAGAPCAVLRSAHPYLAFAKAVALLTPTATLPAGVHRLAVVASGATVDPTASIGAFVVVDEGAHVGPRTVIHAHAVIARGARVGSDCVIHSHVSVRERVRIGDRVVIQNGAVVGSDGFGFARTPEGTHHKIPQVGGVTIEDDVEIGANAAIDRPAVGETRIGAGSKIDNLVQVAHGVSIGRHVLLAAQVGIAGSTTIEDSVTLAGQVGVAGHITIGRGTMATAQTGVPNSVEPGSFISGYPAIANRDWLRASAVFRRLPDLRKAVSDLQARLAELEARLDRKAP